MHADGNGLYLSIQESGSIQSTTPTDEIRQLVQGKLEAGYREDAVKLWQSQDGKRSKTALYEKARVDKSQYCLNQRRELSSVIDLCGKPKQPWMLGSQCRA